MSTTKWLKKRLLTLTTVEKTNLLEALRKDLEGTKNPLQRWSIKERIRMIEPRTAVML